MTNSYFDNTDTLSDHTQARGTAVDAKFTAVEVGFEKLPTEDDLKQSKVTYCADTGTADAYVLTPTYPIAAYGAGQRFSFFAAYANTGASTVNISDKGARSLKRADGDPLNAGDIAAGAPIEIMDNGTECRLVGWHGSDVDSALAATAASAAAASGSASAASGYAGLASSSATLASNYADKVDAYVTGTDNSAKAWAIGGTGTGQPSDGDAKSWAQKTGAYVTGVLLSAQEWAVGTFKRGVAGFGSAKDWATYTGATVDNADYSAKEHAVGTTVTTGSAKDWATKTAAEVVTGQGFGAKKYATDAATSASAAAVSATAASATVSQWAAAGGTADAITATYPTTVTVLTDGMILSFRAASDNATTTPTFKADGTTAHTITKKGGSAVTAGSILANGEYLVRYNLANTRWEILNPSKTSIATDVVGLGAGIATFLGGAAASYNTTASTASGTPVTVYDVTGKCGLLIITASLPAVSGSYATATVAIGANAGETTVNILGSSGMTISTPTGGAAIQITQTSGSSRTIRWGVLYIPSPA